MNIKQVIFFLSLLALYLSMVHGQMGHLSLSRTEKIEQKYSEEIKQYQKALTSLDIRLRQDSMTKKYKSIPVERIVQLLESVSVYEKHILNSSFLSLRKFLKKNRCMIENILEEEEILSQNVIHKLYTKTETSFEKIFETYKAHKKAFSSRGLMYYSGIKKIKELKKTLLTQAFNEEKLGFTGIIEKIHFRYLHKPTHFMIQNPQYVLLPFLAWGAYKMMYPQQEISGNSMSGGNESKMPPQSKKSHSSSPSSTSQQKQKKMYDLEASDIKIETSFKEGIQQKRNECALYATFHLFTLLLEDEVKAKIFEEIKTRIKGEEERYKALATFFDTTKSLRVRYDAFLEYYLQWVAQEDSFVRKKIKDVEKEILENERIIQNYKNLQEELSWFASLFAIEPDEVIKAKKQLQIKKEDKKRIEDFDCRGVNLSSNAIEEFIKYFFAIPMEEKNDSPIMLAEKKDSPYYTFGDGTLFIIDQRQSLEYKMLAGGKTDQVDIFIQYVKDFFAKENPEPLYILITTGDLGGIGHFTSGKIYKKEKTIYIDGTNSQGKGISTVKNFFDLMKAAYETGKIDKIIETKKEIIPFGNNITDTLFQIINHEKKANQNICLKLSYPFEADTIDAVEDKENAKVTLEKTRNKLIDTLHTFKFTKEEIDKTTISFTSVDLTKYEFELKRKESNTCTITYNGHVDDEDPVIERGKKICSLLTALYELIQENKELASIDALPDIK